MAGRPRRGREFWERAVAEFTASGLSRAEFARRRGLSEKTLGRWSSVVAQAATPVPSAPVRLVEVKVDTPGRGEVGVVAELGPGVVVRFPPTLAAEYVAAVLAGVAGVRSPTC